MKEKIGTATIRYDIDNNVISGVFKGALEQKFDKELLEQLIPSNDPNVIKNNADMALASWFNKITDIELADREVSQIISSVKKRTYHSNGNIKKCSIDYFLETKEDN